MEEMVYKIVRKIYIQERLETKETVLSIEKTWLCRMLVMYMWREIIWHFVKEILVRSWVMSMVWKSCYFINFLNVQLISEI